MGSIVGMDNGRVASLMRQEILLICEGGLGSALDELAMNMAVCEKHGVYLIEDGAHALGQIARYRRLGRSAAGQRQSGQRRRREQRRRAHRVRDERVHVGVVVVEHGEAHGGYHAPHQTRWLLYPRPEHDAQPLRAAGKRQGGSGHGSPGNDVHPSLRLGSPGCGCRVMKVWAPAIV